jgi:hypothetical protein
MHAPRLLALYVVAAAACGRLSFDKAADAGDAVATPDVPVLPVCLDDDFSGAASWTTDGGRWALGTGPFGTAWRNSYTTGASFTVPVPVRHWNELDLELQADVTARNVGDMFVQLINPTGQTYQINLFPIDSDDPIDSIERATEPRVTVAMTGNALPASAGTWSRVRVVYRAGTFDVFVDDVLHMHGTDTVYPPPFGPAVGFTFGGAFDNLTLRCQ